MSTTPTPDPKIGKYEFNAEENRTITELANAMGVVATLMKVVGLIFLIFFGLTLYRATATSAVATLETYGPIAALGGAALICLAIGFWTGSSAHSFRRIVESQNRDVWHLMNALGSLRDMYALLRTIVIGTLVLTAVGAVLFLFGWQSAP